MTIQGKYGVALTVPFQIWTFDGQEFYGGTDFVAGDVTVSKDGAATATITTTAVTSIGDGTFSIGLSNLEMEAGLLVLDIEDKSGTVWLSTTVVIETQAAGNKTIATGKAQAGTASTIQLAASETFADDVLNGNIAIISAGTGAGQQRVITDYVSSTDTATITPDWSVTPDATSIYDIMPGSVNITAVSNTAEDIALEASVTIVSGNIDTVLAAQASVLAKDTAVTGGASTITLAVSSSFADGILVGNTINIISGTGAGQSRVISVNALTGDLVTVSRAWTTVPDVTSEYEIVEGSVNVDTGIDDITLPAATMDAIAVSMLDLVAGIEANLTPRQGFRLIVAALAGKISGAGTTTVTIKDTNDNNSRIVATVDASGNRTAVTTILTD